MNEINFDNFDKICNICKKLAQEKNILYGTKNLTIFKGLGIIVRINDKIARLNNLVKLNNLNKINNLNETINDTILDLINYGIYFYLYINKLLLKDNKLKEVKKE